MARRLVIGGLILALGACSASPATSPTPTRPAATGAPSATPTAEATTSATASPSGSAEPLTWTQLDSSGPAAREDHTWTLGDDRVAYLFGGRDGATVFGDTWAFDIQAGTWAELAPAASPPARFGHEAAWVDGIGVVVFAGQAGATFFGDLWAFDPAAETWTELPAGGELPVARYGSCAAVGPDGRLWISHGFTADQVRFSDTRAYDFSTGSWSDETPSDGRPVERCLHGCWWTDGDELALYAGQTTGATALGDRWRLEDGSWSRVEGDLPPDRNLYARARVDGATLVFGGQAIDESYLSDLWALIDGRDDAVAVEPAGALPPGRAGAEMIRDGERVLLFGGRNAEGALDDVWELSGDLRLGE